ncbi:MAG: precorrin-4 C(11)-methyltransferase [Ruminococcus sp.]|nr:precorrin-4 C(11)-methyltransferase [Ruminococcus sp.]
MVDIVGAGPGAADLITVRGMRLLSRADRVIYAGSLVNRELLGYTREGCKLYDSSKMTLDEVIEVIKEAEDRGENTVRLHTGDPSIYGAIREQTDRLDDLGIKYRICPGVSSFCGAAAALGAEYTLPGGPQTVILTRRGGRTAVPEGESIERLAAHRASMVIFLSTSMAQELEGELIAGGYSGDTPAAVVYKATWEDERVLRCTVGTLGETVRAAGISKTALITVGDFLGESTQVSKLYDPEFSTGYRKAVK